MTDVNETLEEVFYCLPCLQVNRTREVCRRYRKIIEAKDKLWMPKEVTLGMIRNFKEDIDFDNFARYVIGYRSPYAGSDDVEVLNAKECVQEIEQSRRTSVHGFEQRVLQSFALSVSNQYNNGVGGKIGRCDKYCSPQCPHKANAVEQHIAALKDNVSVDEVMKFFEHVTADYFELYVESSAFTTELIGRLFHSEKMKAAKALAIELVYHPTNELWKFVTAAETKHFGRMLYVQIDEDMRVHCIEQFRVLGHIPLVFDNLRTSDRMTIFVFKNPISRETLVLRFGGSMSRNTTALRTTCGRVSNVYRRFIPPVSCFMMHDGFVNWS